MPFQKLSKFPVIKSVKLESYRGHSSTLIHQRFLRSDTSLVRSVFFLPPATLLWGSALFEASSIVQAAVWLGCRRSSCAREENNNGAKFRCMSRVSTRCMYRTICDNNNGCTNRVDAVIYALLNVMSKWFRLQRRRRSFTAGDALSTSPRVSHPTKPLSSNGFNRTLMTLK